MPVLEALIEPGNGLDSGRMGLLAALGRLAPERALAFVARLRVRHDAEGDWLKVPRAAPWLEVAGIEADTTDLEELEKLMMRRRTALAESASQRWVVFPGSEFGVLDLWATPIDGRGRAGRSFYLGRQPLPPPGAEQGTVAMLEARLSAGHLDVGFPGGQRLVVGVEALAADRDGDRLTDRLEAHLGLDPASRDSDGDGLADRFDRAPNGGRAEPSREERAFLALHEIQSLVFGADVESQKAVEEDGLDLWSAPKHRFLVDAPPLEWQAGADATFRIPDRVVLEAQTAGYRLAARPPRPIEPDELAVEQYLSCPSEYGQGPGLVFVLRETRGGWVVSGLGE